MNENSKTILVDKTLGAIKKAVMKMRNTVDHGDEGKQIFVPEFAEHFEPEQSRQEKRKDIVLTRLQNAANEESARMLASEN